MADSDWTLLRKAFAQAMILDGTSRERYIDDFSARYPHLVEEFLRLLEADGDNESLLRQSVEDSVVAFDDDPEDPWIGRQLGVYNIVERIAVGGMGAVFRAERIDAEFEQRVAIKIMGSQLFSADAIARIKAERQILASLSHPNIAQLYDGGTTKEGLPYLVMEYVDGLPVDEYCDVQALSVRRRLNVFEAICHAVDYAHRNLVVHRDIKPSNILITEDGAPKLLDFGIAKLIEPQAAKHTVAMTQVGQRVLTLDYASPEQVRAERVTTVTDVYSLGVLLYRLLTGHSPYESTGHSVLDLEREILESNPKKPSSKITEPTTVNTVSSSGAIGHQRSTTISRLRKRLMGDLDNIVLMAMRKEPERRYASPSAMVVDINRYLAHLPIVARPDSWRYRGAKFFRRNALAASAVTIAFGLLAAFALVTTYQNERISEERDVASAVSDFLVETFRVAKPDERPGETVTAREVLDASRARIDTLQSEPRVRARLLVVMGDAYSSLGIGEDAVSLHEQALALGRQGYLSDVALADLTSDLAGELSSLTRFDEASGYFDDAFSLYERLPDASLFARTVNKARYASHVGRLGKQQESLTLNLQALEAASTLSNDPDGLYPWLLYRVGIAYTDLDKIPESEDYFRKALASDHPEWAQGTRVRADTLGALAYTLLRLRRFNEALTYCQQSLATMEVIYEPDHPKIASASSRCALVLWNLGRFEEAEAAIRRTIASRTKVAGPDHYRLASSYVILARIKQHQKQYDEALTLAQKSLEIRLATLPAPHRHVASSYQMIGMLHRYLEQYGESLINLDKALTIYLKIFDEENIRVVDTLTQQGKTLASMSDYAGAEAKFMRALPIHEKISPTEPLADVLRELGKVLKAVNRCEEAIAYMERAITEFGKVRPADNPEVVAIQKRIASCQRRLSAAKSDPG